MKKLLLLIIVFLVSLAESAVAYEIVVIKSGLSKINKQVQQTFTEELGKRVPHRGLKAIQSHQLTEVVIVKGERQSVSAQKIRNSQPDLILALGSKALKVALSIPDIPIVYLLVIKSEEIIGNRTNVTGISLIVPPKVQLDEMSRFLPRVKRVGVVYDPNHSSNDIEQMRESRPDLEFVFLAAEKAAEVPGLISSLKGQVDLLWMLPDITVTNQKTLQSYFLFSVKNKMPLLTFSEKFLKNGATLAVTFDMDAMAGQAADLAIEMLSDSKNGKLPTSFAPMVKTVVNHKIAKKLHVSIAGGKTDD